jgi:hypothetical protein
MTSITRAVRQAFARAKLTQSFVPKLGHIRLLDPDKSGALRHVSRQEAIDRRIPVYVSTRLSVLDKVFEVQGGGHGVIRYAANGLTAGQLRFQRQNSPKGATAAATLDEVQS